MATTNIKIPSIVSPLVNIGTSFKKVDGFFTPSNTLKNNLNNLYKIGVDITKPKSNVSTGSSTPKKTTVTATTATQPKITYPKVDEGNILMIPKSGQTSNKALPNSLLVNVFDVDFIPFQKKWEFFEAVEGKQVIEKQCDTYAELKCKVLVAPDVLSSYIYDGTPRAPEYNEEFEVIRESLFMDYEGLTMIFSSSMFHVFTGVINEFSYAIETGDKDAIYNLEVFQVV